MDLRETFVQLKQALFDSSKRNPFVNIKLKELWFPEEDSERIASKVYRNANFLKKEYGLETSLHVYLFLSWDFSENENESDFVISPIVYKPTRVKKLKRIVTTYAVEETDETLYVNPIIRHLFLQKYEIDIGESTASVDAFIETFRNQFETEHISIPMHEKLEISNAWSFFVQAAVGNFNYKKSSLAKDYEQIIAHPNQSVTGLLNGVHESSNSVPLEVIDTIQLDDSQYQAVAKGLNSNLIIQGPPGTGKSHTITGLITSFLAQNKKVLFVSEKKSALDVVYDRLAKMNLSNSIAYFNTQKDEKRTFYHSLKTTWTNLTQEPFLTLAQKNISISEDIFSYYPRRIFEINERYGVSIHALENSLLELNIPPVELLPHGTIPKFEEWRTAEPFLADFETNYLANFNVNQFKNAPFIYLNSSIFSEEDFIYKLEKRLQDALRIMTHINDVQHKFGIEEDYDRFVKLAITASILTMVDKSQIELLHANSKGFKQFDTYSKKYERTKLKLQQVVSSNAKWSNKPSFSEITELMDLLTRELKSVDKRRNIFRLMRQNSSRIKMAFKDFDASISIHTKIKLLEGIKLEWQLKSQLDEVKLKLKHTLNITDPANEIALILNLRNKLNAVSHNEYLVLLEHEQSADLISILSKLHPDILQFNSIARFLFKFRSYESIQGITRRLNEILSLIPIINQFQFEFVKFFQIPNSVLNFLASNEGSVCRLGGIVRYATLKEITRFDPLYQHVNGWSLMDEFDRKKSEKQLIFETNLQRIHQARIQTFNEKELLLTKPSFKLTKEKRQFKAALKQERKILLHEMNKKQQYLPVVDLLTTCSGTLMDILPVWMMNPLAVSEKLPCESELFDVVIFDEASQIPLEDSLPSIYRAKQVVIVGDEQQMPPTTFFTSRKDVKTILDQGQFSFPTEMLKWHYRSAHPALISFSNDNFYQNNLWTLPPAKAEVPLLLKKVEGVFHERKNIAEAIEIAKYTHELLLKGEQDIGIIAFSKEQENEIRFQLKEHIIPLDARVLIRNLENVQGIEREIILISVAYAPNAEGFFRLNFGPINKASGANRLNVLFSRAIRQMVVFTAISHQDISLSNNRGVSVLCGFLRYIESFSAVNTACIVSTTAEKMIAAFLTSNNKAFDYYALPGNTGLNCFISYSKNTLLLVNPGKFENDPANLYAYIAALRNTFKTIKIILEIDLWMNKSKVEKELLLVF